MKLGRRSYSSWEIRNFFKDEIPEIEEIIAEFTEQGYINDDEWLKSFIRIEEGKGNGPHTLKSKLRQKGIPQEVIEAALTEASPQESLATAIYKKTKGRPITKESKQKLIAFLARRGFSWDTIQNALYDSHNDAF